MAFASSLLMAYVANDDRRLLRTAFSRDGLNWVNAKFIEGQTSNTAPSVAVLRNEVVMAYVAHDESHSLLTTSSPDGITWAPSRTVEQRSATAPALAAIADHLVMIYVAKGFANELTVALSIDGIDWIDPRPLMAPGSRGLFSLPSGSAPAFAFLAAQNLLVIAYVAEGAHDNVFVAVSDGGDIWDGPIPVGVSSKFAPALVVADDELVMAYVSNTPGNELMTLGTRDVSDWGRPRPIVGQSSKDSPALRVTENEILLAYVANNERNSLLTAASADGIAWTRSRPAAGESSKSPPSLCFPTPLI